MFLSPARTVLPVMMPVTWSTVREGFDERRRATAPATCGEAIEVPDIVVVAVSLVWYADNVPTPGAQMSRQEPKLEKLAFASVMSVAPTVIADAARAGEKSHALLLEFPAATTTTIPSATAAATASSVALFAPPPRLMFITAGVPAWWWEIAHSMPATIVDV